MDKIFIDTDQIRKWKKKNCSDCVFSLDYEKSEISSHSDYDCKIQKTIDQILLTCQDELVPIESVNNLFPFKDKGKNDHCMNHVCKDKEYYIDIYEVEPFDSHIELNHWFNLNCQNCKKSNRFNPIRPECHIEKALSVASINPVITISRQLAAKIGLYRNENFYPFNRLCDKFEEKKNDNE